MNNLKGNYSEIAEIENKIALLKEEIDTFRNNADYDKSEHVKMQIELGKMVNRLEYLKF